MPTLIVTSTANGGAGSLRAAIANAQHGDTIAFDSALAGQTIHLSQQLEIRPGKSITIDGSNAAGLALSGNHATRIFYVNSNQDFPASLNLKNLDLVNGYSNDRGGAIYVTHRGNTSVENVTFKNNTADNGGGAIYSAYETNLTVVGSTFDSNKAIAGNDERGAGGIAFASPGVLTVRDSRFINNEGINGAAINSLQGKLTIDNSEFLNNSTTAATYDTGQPNPFLRGYGGAIYTDRASSGSNATSGTITIRNSTFERNKGRGEGGAAYLYTGTQDRVLIEGSLFRNNEVMALPNGGNGGNGGAVVQMNNGPNQGFTIRDTQFIGNVASGQGGGLWMMDAPTTISNTTFSGNRVNGTASNKIGGAMALYGSTTIENSTIANNYAGWVGGGISASRNDTVRVKDTIFYNNTADNGTNNWGIQQHTNRELIDLGGNYQYPPKATNNGNDYNATASIETATDPQLSPLEADGTHRIENPAISGSGATSDGSTGSIGAGRDSPSGGETNNSGNPSGGSDPGDGMTGESPENTNDEDSMTNADFLNQVLQLTNQFRAENGVAPLVLNTQLAEAAQDHSESMAQQDFFSHTGANGSSVGDRVRGEGYNYTTVGENIAAGQTTPEAVVNGWINSEGHRANMLNPNYKELGVGYYLLTNDTGDVNYQHYWTQVFGSSPDSPTGGETGGETGGGTGGETGGGTGGGTGGETGGGTGGETGSGTGGGTDGGTGGETGGQPDGQPDGQTGGQPDGQTGGQPDGQTGVDMPSGEPQPKPSMPKPKLIEIDGFLIEGTPDNDRLIGNRKSQVFMSGDGIDLIRAKAGHDELYGGKHSDELFGGSGNDMMMGRRGADILYGQKGNDVLRGGRHNDVLNGFAGDDQIFGGRGDDRLFGGQGRDQMLGHKGNDRLRGGQDDDLLKGSAGRDRLSGDGGSDRLFGGKDGDRLFGRSGNDRLSGGDGNDKLSGGIGNDWLFGGKGSDRLTGVTHRSDESGFALGSGEMDISSGGEGADTFVLGNADDAFYANNGMEDYVLIKDFSVAEGDTVELQGSADLYQVDAVPAGIADGAPNAQAIFKQVDGSQELIAVVKGDTINLARDAVFV